MAESAKCTVLYADDDHDDIYFFEKAIQSINDQIELQVCLDGHQTYLQLLRLAHAQSLPALVILDINMPKLTGREVLKRIRENPELENLPVAFFSTSSLDADKNFARHYNAEYFIKPFDAREFEPILQYVIEHCLKSTAARRPRRGRLKSIAQVTLPPGWAGMNIIYVH